MSSRVSPRILRGPGRAPCSPALLVTAALLACDGGPTEPLTVESVAGTYEAVTFTTTEQGTTTNWLARGASITLGLAADSTTSGRLFVPEGNEDGSDFEADLTGTWSLTADTVRLAHGADTFLRDMDFLVRERRLFGEAESGGVETRVTLQR